MAVNSDLEKCNGCGTCVEACPSEALKVEKDKVVIDEDACVDCGVCVDECPEEALAMDE
jgi:NAD-dependent dihydropyrimidine dehydrogenase PreA subunit